MAEELSGPPREGADTKLREPFDTLAFLLLPEHGGAAMRAGPGWELRDPPAGSSVVWGREPWPPETPIARAARSTVGRERALVALRRRAPAGTTLAAIHRWPPPGHRHDIVTDRARAALLGGAVAELVREPGPRVIDLCARAATTAGPVHRISPVSAGAVIGRALTRTGTPAVLRATHREGPGDPKRATAALELLQPSGWGFVPRPFGCGEVGKAVWALELELPGRRPSRLSRTVMVELRTFCSSLPRDEGPPEIAPAVEVIASAFPRWTERIRRLGRALEGQVRAMQATMAHGDLWAGNLLVSRGRLTGLIDWDGWERSGVPGTDLLHLYATDLAVRSGKQLGAVWLTRPWRSDWFTSWMAPYWRALGLQPDPDLLDAVGSAWWVHRVSYRLRVRPRLAGDRRWVSGTVETVLDALEE